jgi:hypothetical protein
MDGFKSSPKMQCFKEGGAVKYKSRHSEKSEMSEDIAQDKKVVKKAFAMHDKQSHEGDKTNLSKLKKGGRMKKEGGCVGRYKEGGSIKMKKNDADIKDIQKIKLTKTKKAAAPSKAAIKPAMSNIAEPAMSADMGMTPPPMMKKGGYAKKCAEGGSLKSVDAEENPGLAKLPTNVRNKMGYAKKGGNVKKMNVGGRSDIEEVKENLYMRPGENTTYSKVRGIGPAIAASRLKERGVDIPGLIANRARNSSEDPYKKGGKVKKYADGGIVDNIKAVGKKLYENMMGTPEQNKAAAEQEKAIAEKDPSSYEAKYRKLTGKKRGGKAC